MNLFVDTSAFLAVLNVNDQNHQKAKQFWIEVLASDTVLYSSNYVLLETTALLQHRFGIYAVRLFDNRLRPAIEITWVNEQIHKLGMGILITANHRNLSLVDCISFELMRQARIENVFTFDAHFSEQGFVMMP